MSSRSFWALVLALWTGVAGVAGAVGTTGAPFLRIAAGARPEAMGGAYTGVSDDLNALFWNPAGLARVAAPECGALYTTWLAGTTTSLLGYARPAGTLGTLAGAASILDYGSTPRTVATDDGLYGGTSGTVSAMDTFAEVGWGRRMAAGLDAGAAAKVVIQRFAGASRSGLGADLGVLWTTPERGLKAGLAGQNLGVMTSGGALLPMTWRLGAAWETPLGSSLRALWAADAEMTADAGTRVHAGAEFSVLELVALRGGWRGGAIAGGPTFGVGLLVPGSWVGLSGALRIDYAGGQADELGMTHRIQLLFRFGARPTAGRASGFKVETVGPDRWLVWTGGPGPWEVTVRRPGEGRGEAAALGGGFMTDNRVPLESLDPGTYVVAVRRADAQATAWQNPSSIARSMERALLKPPTLITGIASFWAKGFA